MDIKKNGFLQALGVTLYCSMIGLLISNGEHVFGKINNFFGPILFLMLFSTSALICGSIVFYKPYKLFMKDDKKGALNLVVTTTAWLAVFLVVLFAIILIIK